ncbi:sensor histidine kinase [Myceligenerans cantabricum]
MTGPVQRVRAFDGRHPLWWDISLVLALTLISINATPQLDLLGTALLVVVGGTVLFRRRSPFASLLTAVTGVGLTAVIASLTDLHLAWAYLGVWVLLFNVGLRDAGRRVAIIGALVGATALAAFADPVDGTAADVADRFRSSLTVAAMCAASFLVGAQIHSQRKALASQQQEAARAAVVAERSRIAQEMHDLIGHNLSVITSLANGGAVAARNAPQDAVHAFDAIGAVSRSSVREVRRVLTVLRHDQSPDGASLSPQPGMGDVEQLVESVRSVGVRARLERTGDLSSLSAGRQLAVYRIVQESLTNVLRHADAPARVDITIARQDDELVLLVDDSGAATPATHRSDGAVPGHGILGMRERAQAYGGTLEAHPFGTGWRVRARIPAEQEKEP